jgi:cell division protein FtsZ
MTTVLGNEIGITLIATGFEHKDPFARETKPVAADNKDQKIVLELEMPKKAEAVQQPAVQAEAEPEVVPALST